MERGEQQNADYGRDEAARAIADSLAFKNDAMPYGSLLAWGHRALKALEDKGFAVVPREEVTTLRQYADDVIAGKRSLWTEWERTHIDSSGAGR